MIVLSTFCSVCLHDGEELRCLDDLDYDNIPLLSKLNYCSVENEWADSSDVSIAICNQCCHILRLMYSFKQMCTKNSEILRGYVSQLTEGGEMANMLKNKKKIQVKVSLKSVKKYVDQLNNKSQLTYNKNSDKNNVDVLNEDTIKDNLDLKSNNENKIDSDEEELQTVLEPKIEIVEHKIDETVKKIKITKVEGNQRRKKSDVLIYGNDLQEKSSTSTLDSLSKLVGEANAEGIEIIKHIVGAPIQQPQWELDFDSSWDFEAPRVASPEILPVIQPEPSPVLIIPATKSKPIRSQIETIYIKQEIDETSAVVLENENEEPELDELTQDLLNRTDNFCPVCNKKFQCQSYYERHITIHTGLKTHKCLLCTKKFTRKSTLKTHMNTHTSESYYPCSFCGEIFNHKSVWQDHVTIHDRTDCKQREGIQKKPYKHKYFPCGVCGKVFSSKGNLKTHLNIHNRAPDAVFNGYRKYSNSLPTKKAGCPICGKMILKTYMSVHISTHSSEFLWLKSQIGK